MKDSTINKRYEPGGMGKLAQTLFLRAGLEQEKAQAVASILLEADMMGHVTHGLALLPAYLGAAESGALTCHGEPDVISDRGACITWQGKRLPGPWLTAKAVDLALDRVQTYGTVTVAISDSHHIGALAAYLKRATDRGYMLLIASSMPSLAGVAPYGGTRAVFTPNPMAVGIPTDGDPILLDVSSSITTINLTKQLAKAGKKFPYPWLMDTAGNASNDPETALSQGGTLLPVGGLDHGHKGYSWALLVEALSTLSGFGRAEQPSGTSVSVFIQAIDPNAFGGQDRFKHQMTWLGNACKDNPPRTGVERVRLPGERALAHIRESKERGVALSDSIIEGLAHYAEKYGLQMPAPLK